MAQPNDAGIGRQVKLRRSCNGCNEAKMGCSKDKPTCARCERRGETCVYAPTRRVGRPGGRERKKDPATPSPSAASVSESTDGTSPISVVQASYQSPSLIPLPARNDSAHTQEVNLTDFFISPAASSSEDLLSMSGLHDPFSIFESDLAGFGAADIDIFGKSSFPTSLSDAAHAQTLSAYEQTNVANSNGTGETNVTFDEFPAIDVWCGGYLLDECDLDATSPLLRVTSIPQQTSSVTTVRPSCPALNGVVESPGAAKTASPSHNMDLVTTHGCLACALKLLERLTPRIDPCQRSSDTTLLRSMAPTFQDIMTRNESCMDAVRQILECSCSDQLNLLHILSLIMSTALGWYAAASASSVALGTKIQTGMIDNVSALSSSSSSSSSATGSQHLDLIISPPPSESLADYIDPLDDQEQGRAVCQIVLSKLHTAQRLVNLLSQRLLACKEQAPGSSQTTNRLARITQDLMNGGGTMLNGERDLTGSMAEHLDIQLRNRMQLLSQAIIENLQQYT